MDGLLFLVHCHVVYYTFIFYERIFFLFAIFSFIEMEKKCISSIDLESNSVIWATETKINSIIHFVYCFLSVVFCCSYALHICRSCFSSFFFAIFVLYLDFALYLEINVERQTIERWQSTSMNWSEDKQKSGTNRTLTLLLFDGQKKMLTANIICTALLKIE